VTRADAGFTSENLFPVRFVPLVSNNGTAGKP
jgi:hypothetical protein